MQDDDAQDRADREAARGLVNNVYAQAFGDTTLDTEAILSMIGAYGKQVVALQKSVEYMEAYFKANFDAGGPIITKINKLEMYLEQQGLEPKSVTHD